MCPAVMLYVTDVFLDKASAQIRVCNMQISFLHYTACQEEIICGLN